MRTTTSHIDTLTLAGGGIGTIFPAGIGDIAITTTITGEPVSIPRLHIRSLLSIRKQAG
jgi:hypothetical protein